MNKFIILFITLITSIVYASRTVKIMIIDTGVSLTHEELNSHVKDTNNINYIDEHSHGTHVAGLILKNTCKEVELISCKYWFKYDSSQERIRKSTNCFKEALKQKVQIVNYSSVGNMSDKEEYKILKELEKVGIIIVTAAGNDNKDISLIANSVYIAGYNLKNIIVVGNLNDDGSKAFSSNYGLKRMVWEKGMFQLSTLPDYKYGYMSGSSQATANHTNKILLKWCKEL